VPGCPLAPACQAMPGCRAVPGNVVLPGRAVRGVSVPKGGAHTATEPAATGHTATGPATTGHTATGHLLPLAQLSNIRACGKPLGPPSPEDNELCAASAGSLAASSCDPPLASVDSLAASSPDPPGHRPTAWKPPPAAPPGHASAAAGALSLGGPCRRLGEEESDPKRGTPPGSRRPPGWERGRVSQRGGE